MSAHRTATTLARCALVIVAFVVSALAPAALDAQVFLFPVQDLRFGNLRPGMAELVDPDDAVRRGELELVGDGTVVISIGLPTEMVSVGGHRLPLSFDKKDAVLEMRDSGKDKDFDPTKPKKIKIKAKDGGARILLGGMALPDASQPPGRYTATITVQIVTAGT